LVNPLFLQKFFGELIAPLLVLLQTLDGGEAGVGLCPKLCPISANIGIAR